MGSPITVNICEVRFRRHMQRLFAKSQWTTPILALIEWLARDRHHKARDWVTLHIPTLGATTSVSRQNPRSRVTINVTINTTHFWSISTAFHLMYYVNVEDGHVSLMWLHLRPRKIAETMASIDVIVCPVLSRQWSFASQFEVTKGCTICCNVISYCVVT